jgi:hypothetical protein
LERACDWTVGLLLASTQVVAVVEPLTTFEECCCLSALLAEVTPGAPGMAVDFDELDQGLQVSQPSAERVDMRQQDQRLPLQKPAW